MQDQQTSQLLADEQITTMTEKPYPDRSTYDMFFFYKAGEHKVPLCCCKALLACGAHQSTGLCVSPTVRPIEPLV